MVMEATKEIVSKEPLAGSILPDQFDRTPLEDDQLLSVDNLNVMGPRDMIGKDKLYQLANNVGLLDVVRWKPRLVCVHSLLRLMIWYRVEREWWS